MLSKVAKILDKATKLSQDDPDFEMNLCDTDSESEENDAYDHMDSDDDHGSASGWSPDSPQGRLGTRVGPVSERPEDNAAMRALNRRIRTDLRAAKDAGFRVGHLGTLLNNGEDAFVIISCRVAKLGISDEALQAWDLDPSLYFLLLIRYRSGYKTLERLVGGDLAGSKNIEIRVGLSSNYKIQLLQAIDAFSQLKDKRKEQQFPSSQSTSLEGLYPLFIGRPLEELLNERLVTILKYRLEKGLSWGGSEKFYSEYQGAIFETSDYVESNYWIEDNSELTKTFQNIVTADHIADGSTDLSFPLLAMQFALRHLVRCTEFCLVCHCKVDMDFEALKPYVCSKPLCLYQYMALGFGPSIEHEIVSQPHVVDLLVSFCYASANYGRLGSFPVGMGLTVPRPCLLAQVSLQSMYGSTTLPSSLSAAARPAGAMTGILKGSPGDGSGPAQIPTSSGMDQLERLKYTAKFDQRNMELIFPPGDKTLRVGQWICVLPTPGNPDVAIHCRVIEAMHPVVRLGTPNYVDKIDDRTRHQTAQAMQQNSTSNRLKPDKSAPEQQSASYQSVVASVPTPASTPSPPVLTEVEFAIYDQNFDDLSKLEKSQTISLLLDTLPSVRQMRDYLQSMNGIDTSLRTWHNRFSPAALGILRWIIASNRSCLIQVDDIDKDIDKDSGKSNAKSEERVSGMPQWMQFRIAQGAPDKEQRFISSVRQESRNQNHPTIFAWHGSPLQNWHGIVREGLHFKDTANGRAYGNGVYHAKDVSTSLGYSGSYARYSFSPMPGAAQSQWPQSELKITAAITLNEIVNAPEQFVSKSPYLVVSQLDWIQSRYLFVQCSRQSTEIDDKHPTRIYEQDPAWTPTGASSEKIAIPITVVSKSRRPVSKTVKNGNKKAKVNTTEDDAIILSDDTDVEDITILLSDDDNASADKNQTGENKGKSIIDLISKQIPETPKTDFRPGVLDHSTLPLLAPPTYATTMATRSLQRELANTLQIQATHPSHELGWYINPDLVENVYQWIVELHSFEAHLPLAKDLKARKLNSVVIEIRFGKDYPMSPPFVRVIRPRFLSFMAGGGGHVTAGGALCMQLLTNSGWSAVSNIESVLLQVRLAISSTDPRPARLDPAYDGDYQVGEAVDAFIRACHTHGVSLPCPSRCISVSLLRWSIVARLAPSDVGIIVGSTARLSFNLLCIIVRTKGPIGLFALERTFCYHIP